jgi:hypothetical protein
MGHDKGDPMTDLPDDYVVPLKQTSTKNKQLHVAITTEARQMLTALCTLHGQSTNTMVQTLIYNACYGKTLNAAERKHLWKLIEQEATR